MRIPTYNQAKGRAISHKITMVAGYSKKKSKRKRGKSTKIKKLGKYINEQNIRVKPIDYPKVIGKITKGYIFENAIVLSVQSIAYVAICSNLEEIKEGQHGLFIRAYTKCKESDSKYRIDSQEVSEHRSELTEIAKSMSIGEIIIDDSSWEALHAEAVRIMDEYTAKPRIRVQEAALMVVAKAHRVHNHRIKLLEKINTNTQIDNTK